FWSRGLRHHLGFVRRLTWFDARIVIIASEIIGVDCVSKFRPRYFDGRLHSGVAAILTQKRFSRGRSPLDRSQQQAVTASQREKLLLRAGPEALLAQNLTATSI